jgi:hypothetical protein
MILILGSIKVLEHGTADMVASKPNNAALWSRVKTEAKKKFRVYPSAYANAWAAKEYKNRGGTWSGADNRVKRG